MVVMGNPPYSGHSANTGKWIADLLRGRDTHTGRAVANYFEVNGHPLGERNPKMLNDDYVKFIRFAQWRIEQTGYGVLAFITNHGYLDNPTFRGMRQSLMETFDDIYVLDLHGNSKKKERAPDGSKDENVFDIQQGVAIGLFVKRKGALTGGETAVRHAHLWGVREIYEEDAQDERVLSGGKYDWLWRHDVSTTEWTTLEPQSPFYFFMPQNINLLSEYEQGSSVTEIMPINSSGMNTARDALVINIDKKLLLNRISMLANADEAAHQLAEDLGVQNTGWWNLDKAVKKLRETPGWEKLIIEGLHKPFDKRWLFYHPSFIDRPRENVNSHMLKENISLVTTRQTKESFAAIVTNLICSQHKITAIYDRSFFFPLYLYPNDTKTSLFGSDEPTDAPGGRRPNLAPEFIADFVARIKMAFIPDGKGNRTETFGPEDVFSSMYAVFHSPTYRSRYAEFLKIDFPRLPLTSHPELFRSLCSLGDELVGLHLMERHAPFITTYLQDGTHKVEQVRYTAPGEAGSSEGRVWINKEQYFENVPPEVWNFHVGGYQVCQKWLKDRKGRTLTYDDLNHYQQIVSALAETIRLMTEIDETIENHGGWPL